MKRFSAQFIITNSGPILKRGIVTVEDNGCIAGVEDTSGDLKESGSVEFYNGIIIPGFVNCHCHLELSHLEGTVSQGGGLGRFLENINMSRKKEHDIIVSAARRADEYMFREGVSLCGDICNTTSTFEIKKQSRIKYINLIEVFGIDPEKASEQMKEAIRVMEKSEEMKIPWWLVPHSAYSMSHTLMRLIKEKSLNNKVTSIHFIETAGEKDFIENSSGELMESYRQAGFIPPKLDMVKSHIEAVINEITPSGNLILVHNTFADQNVIEGVKKRDNLFWCLCANSNDYIEKATPPVDLLLRNGCEIVIGTDSLASNTKLSILSELINLQLKFPVLSIEDLVLWATKNGARALGEAESYGVIEPGKNPGLLLLQNVDLINMKLLPESYATRLI